MCRNLSADSYVAVTNQSWWSFLSQSSENVLVPCAIGITLLMCALAIAIFLGTSQLIHYEPYYDRSGEVYGAGMMFIILSILGGYLTSYGFLYIIRDSRRPVNSTQE